MVDARGPHAELTKRNEFKNHSPEEDMNKIRLLVGTKNEAFILAADEELEIEKLLQILRQR